MRTKASFARLSIIIFRAGAEQPLSSNSSTRSSSTRSSSTRSSSSSSSSSNNSYARSCRIFKLTNPGATNLLLFLVSKKHSSRLSVHAQKKRYAYKPECIATNSHLLAAIRPATKKTTALRISYADKKKYGKKKRSSANENAKKLCLHSSVLHNGIK